MRPGYDEALAIIFRDVVLVVKRAGAGDECCVLGIVDEIEPQPFIERRIAGGTDGPGRAGSALGQQGPGHVARGDIGGPGVLRHADSGDLAVKGPGRPWRIGDQHHRPHLRSKPRQSCAGVREGLAAIVDHAPHVAKDRVVARSNLRQS